MPAPAGRARRSNRAGGQFPARLWARRVSRIWARVQAELLAEPAAAVEPGSILPTAHRRPIVPEPVVADPGRAQRMRAQAGGLVAQELAAQRRDKRLAEATRVAALGAHDRQAAGLRAAAKVGILQSDRGADGPAMQARPTCPSGIPGSDAMATADHDPLPLMALTERQEEAAGWLRQYWREAQPALDMPQGWRSGGRGGGLELTADQQLAARQAWQQYQRWMALIRTDCGDQAEAALQAVVVRRELHRSIALVPPTLDYLAAHMGIV